MERDLDRSVSGISGEKVPAPKGHSGFDGYVYIELLRIAACFLVIVNHTNSQVFLSISPSPTWFASLIYFFVSKMAVPLFFMLSGAVLLGKDDGMRKMLGRCARMAAVLLIFSYLYWFLDFYKADMAAALDIPAFLRRVIGWPVSNSLWYLYAYIPMLIMMPVLQKMAGAMADWHFRYFIFWSIGVVGTYPVIVHYLPALNVYPRFALPLFAPVIGLFIAGYYLHRKEIDGKAASFAAGALVLLVGAAVAMTYFEYRKTGGEKFLFLDNNEAIFATGAAMCMFCVGKYICKRSRIIQRPGVGRAVAWMGRRTFGIYLVSDYLIEQLNPVLGPMSVKVHPLVSVVALQFAVFAAGLVISAVMKKIPGLKRLV